MPKSENLMDNSARNFINIDASTGALQIVKNVQEQDGRSQPDLISIIEGNNNVMNGHESSKTLKMADSN